MTQPSEWTFTLEDWKALGPRGDAGRAVLAWLERVGGPDRVFQIDFAPGDRPGWVEATIHYYTNLRQPDGTLARSTHRVEYDDRIDGFPLARR